MTKDDEKIDETYWKCGGCGYTLQVETPPAECPSCHEKCDFHNVTCYAPDCGFTGIDPRLR